MKPTTYSQLPPLMRAALANGDPKTYRKIKTEHEQRIATLAAQLNAATKLADRRRIRAEIAALEQGTRGPVDGPTAA